MHVVNAPPTLPKQRRAGTKRKEWLIIEKRRWPSFQHMYLPCQLHSHSTFHALIKSALPHSMQNHGHYLSVLQSDPLSEGTGDFHYELKLYVKGPRCQVLPLEGLGLTATIGWVLPCACPQVMLTDKGCFLGRLGSEGTDLVDIKTRELLSVLPAYNPETWWVRKIQFLVS